MPSEQEAGKEVEVVVLGSWVEVVRQKLEFAKQAKERMAVELLSVLCPIGMPPSATAGKRKKRWVREEWVGQRFVQPKQKRDRQ